MRKTRMLLPLSLLAAVACGEDESLNQQSLHLPEGVRVNERIYFEGPDGPIFQGGGCRGVSWKRPGEVLPPEIDETYVPSDFELRASDRPLGGLLVSVWSGAEALASREYTMDFLLSGTMDTFTVTTKQGRFYRLFYWGGVCSEDLSPPKI